MFSLLPNFPRNFVWLFKKTLFPQKKKEKSVQASGEVVAATSLLKRARKSDRTGRQPYVFFVIFPLFTPRYARLRPPHPHPPFLRRCRNECNESPLLTLFVCSFYVCGLAVLSLDSLLSTPFNRCFSCPAISNNTN